VKPETKQQLRQTFGSPRWLVFFLSLVMLAAIFPLALAFDWLNRLFPVAQPATPDMIIGSGMTVAFCLLLLAYWGIFLLLASGFWIVAKAVSSALRRLISKPPVKN
jgi:protein-S-isoprenylcysteine O-methyltransferase Ste14